MPAGASPPGRDRPIRRWAARAGGEKTTYKRAATDFSSQVARLKASNCDLLLLGTLIRETIGAIAKAGKAGKAGRNPSVIGAQAAYTDLLHRWRPSQIQDGR